MSSSASTYRDSTLSESTLRNSSASYVTIHESQGQSIPQFTDGTAFMNGNAGNGEVKFSAGELSEVGCYTVFDLTHTHARTHARTHAHTHTHTHTHSFPVIQFSLVINILVIHYILGRLTTVLCSFGFYS